MSRSKSYYEQSRDLGRLMKEDYRKMFEKYQEIEIFLKKISELNDAFRFRSEEAILDDFYSTKKNFDQYKDTVYEWGYKRSVERVSSANESLKREDYSNETELSAEEVESLTNRVALYKRYIKEFGGRADALKAVLGTFGQKSQEKLDKYMNGGREKASTEIMDILDERVRFCKSACEKIDEFVEQTCGKDSNIRKIYELDQAYQQQSEKKQQATTKR